MKKLLLATVIALSACQQPNQATQTLYDAGYTDIQITGYAIWGCSEDDTFHTAFTARSVTGQCVRGVVCGDFFKGDTIRTLGRSNECGPVAQW